MGNVDLLPCNNSRTIRRSFVHDVGRMMCHVIRKGLIDHDDDQKRELCAPSGARTS